MALKDNKSIADLAGRFEDNAPSWFYILAEAQHEWAKAAKGKKGDDNAKNSIHVKLGPLGGRIVTEVLVGLMLGDQFSFLSQWPEWSPLMKQPSNFAPFTPDLKGKFGISDLITIAGLAQDGIQS